jgi:hypothetical protein
MAFRKPYNILRTPLEEKSLFPYDVIVHFSYHKCLTAYYTKIMKKLAKEFGLYQKHFRGHLDRFEEAVAQIQKKSVLSINNKSNINFSKFPNYKGSHFLRDPRDLVVSGYYYHLWTKEKWCNSPDFDWVRITKHRFFATYIENHASNYPTNISYKEYLNSLDKETGFILEIILRDDHFSNMRSWDFANPNIIEFKFEEIISNEAECFRKIFEHYGFHPSLVKRGTQIAELFSLKNRNKSNTGHVRKGTPKQWPHEFSPLLKDLFKEATGDLLIVLDYEKNMSW